MKLIPGSQLRNRYRIVELFGSGSQSMVYHAIDGHSNISVAVKHIRLITPRARAAFAKEVEMLAPLTHPALPRLYDA
ncbi:MAG: serine/threonine protein kinase, partial [Oscillochloridaceae bacterium umkhey_bin13]